MVTIYTFSDLKSIKSDTNFIINYNEYINNTYSIDNINKLLEINTNKKYKQTLRSILNSITHTNFNDKYIKIKTYLQMNNNYETILKDIILFCINDSTYLDKYIIIISDIICNYDINIKYIVQPYFDLLNSYKYNIINDVNTNEGYNTLCINNKQIDNILNYTTLIVKLEQKNIISGYIDIIINKLIKSFKNDINNDLLYTYLLIIYKIISVCNISNSYKEIIKQLISIEGLSKKNKFKLYDIVDMFK